MHVFVTLKSVYTSALEMKDKAGLALFKLRLDPQSFLPTHAPHTPFTAKEKALNIGVHMLGTAVAAADNFANEGSLSGKNLMTKPNMREAFMRMAPRFSQYLTGLATTQNITAIGTAAVLCLLLAYANNPALLEKTADKIPVLFDKAVQHTTDSFITDGFEKMLEAAPHHMDDLLKTLGLH